MADHISAEQLRRYRSRTMAPAESIALFDHVAVCRACREHMGSADQLQSVFVALGTGLYAQANAEAVHLLPEQMAAYVDDEADEMSRTAADDHLKVCTQCRSEMLDLRKVKVVLAGSSFEEPAPITTHSAWGTFVALWRSPAHWIPLQATAMLALLIVCISTFLLRKQVTDLRARVTELQQTNDTLQNQLSSIPALQKQLAELQQSQAQVLSASSEVIVALNDGAGVVTLDRQGRVVGLAPPAPQYEQSIKTALTSQRVKISPVLTELISKPEALMGTTDGHATFSLLSPIGTVIETDRPMFRWSLLDGATSYVVTVSDFASRAVARSPRLSGTEWTVPRSLERGRIYTWDVIATKEGKEITSPRPPTPQAKFKVLEGTKVEELDRARRTHSKSHLVLGVLYAQAGLLDDAERELGALAGANPHSGIAKKLLRSLRSRGDR